MVHDKVLFPLAKVTVFVAVGVLVEAPKRTVVIFLALPKNVVYNTNGFCDKLVVLYLWQFSRLIAFLIEMTRPFSEALSSKQRQSGSKVPSGQDAFTAGNTKIL